MARSGGIDRNERIFGTDGVRGKAGEGWLTRDAVSSLGRAVGSVAAAAMREGALGDSSRKHARENSKPRALLGHDGRRSGPELEAALARGLASQGWSVQSAGLITTPGLALLARLRDFDLAAMVSASHNPAEDNGIKLFTGSGSKVSDELELAVEVELRAHSEPIRTGEPPVVDPELEHLYLSYLVDRVGSRIKLDGMIIVIDCAHGGGSRVAPRVLGRLGAHVVAIGAEPDGENINRECGSTHPEALQAQVRRSSAHLGIALDGDGDRCLLVDERGALVNGDGILTLLAHGLKARGGLRRGRIVATVMSNRGLHRALRSIGVEVVTVAVGDRNVVDEMRRQNLELGGEQSGHIVCGDEHFFIGDGMYTALRCLDVLRQSSRKLSELVAPYEPFPQVLVNVPVRIKPLLTDIPEVADALARVEQDLGLDGRVLLRYSGTEPLLRVMVEGPDPEQIQSHAQLLAGLISARVG